MDPSAEFTHCGVLMTSWAAAGSPTRYYQCPFCGRTFCSAYGELFREAAGVHAVARAPAGRMATARGAAGSTAPAGRPSAPGATPEEVRWRELKGRAARWFAHVEADAAGYRNPSRG
jgi:hypothetical protein